MQSFIIKFHQDRVLKITQPSKTPSNHRMQQKSKSANMETRNHAEGHGTLYQELCNCNDTTLPNNWAGVTTQTFSLSTVASITQKGLSWRDHSKSSSSMQQLQDSHNSEYLSSRDHSK